MPRYSTLQGRELQGKSSSRNDRIIFRKKETEFSKHPTMKMFFSIHFDESTRNMNSGTPAFHQAATTQDGGSHLILCSSQHVASEITQMKMTTQGASKERHRLRVNTGKSISTNKCGHFRSWAYVQDATEVGLVEVGLKPSKSGSRYHLLQHYVTLFSFEGGKSRWCCRKEGWILGRQNQQMYMRPQWFINVENVGKKFRAKG